MEEANEDKKESWHCKGCGNTEDFYASAIERHTWLVDGEGNYIDDEECVDCEVLSVNCCVRCSSYDIEFIELKSPMGQMTDGITEVDDE